ncbi:MAG: acyl-CoA thioesterase [Acidobacteriota bacterium]
MTASAPRAGHDARRYFEYRHIVGFEETNLVGNVYFVNFLRWQGRCREMFLESHCPEMLRRMDHGLALVTTRCACDYLSELRPFDRVSIRMTLVEAAQNRVTMGYEYWRTGGAELEPRDESEPERLAARGEQQIALMERREDGSMVPTPIPRELRDALQRYGAVG